MDICKLKKIGFNPTPGQTEQEYLAIHLQKQRWCLTSTQIDFSLQEMVGKAQKFNFMLPDLI
jgi:hypothetical protein